MEPVGNTSLMSFEFHSRSRSSRVGSIRSIWSVNRTKRTSECSSLIASGYLGWIRRFGRASSIDYRIRRIRLHNHGYLNWNCWKTSVIGPPFSSTPLQSQDAVAQPQKHRRWALARKKHVPWLIPTVDHDAENWDLLHGSKIEDLKGSVISYQLSYTYKCLAARSPIRICPVLWNQYRVHTCTICYHDITTTFTWFDCPFTYVFNRIACTSSAVVILKLCSEDW